VSSTPVEIDNVRALAERIAERYRGELVFEPAVGWRVRDPATDGWVVPDLRGLATAIAANDRVLGNLELAARLAAAERAGAGRSERRATAKALRAFLHQSNALPAVLAALDVAAPLLSWGPSNA
jgi:hypothetical protein